VSDLRVDGDLVSTLAVLVSSTAGPLGLSGAVGSVDGSDYGSGAVSGVLSDAVRVRQGLVRQAGLLVQDLSSNAGNAATVMSDTDASLAAMAG